jgi:hypothetical protein
VTPTPKRPYPDQQTDQVERQERKYSEFTLSFKIPENFERKWSYFGVENGVLKIMYTSPKFRSQCLYQMVYQLLIITYKFTYLKYEMRLQTFSYRSLRFLNDIVSLPSQKINFQRSSYCTLRFDRQCTCNNDDLIFFSDDHSYGFFIYLLSICVNFIM